MEQPGRGRALRAVWSHSDAEVLAYIDVDLSTDLSALSPLVAPLLSGHSDVAIGTRLARGSRVIRGPKRELISRGGRGSSAIASWVAAHFKKETVGGQTVYDHTQPLSSSSSS